MNNKIVIGFLLVIFALNAASATVIEGNNPEYAGKTLHFFRWSDPVTQKEEPVFSVQFDNDGKFSSTVQVSKTTFVFCDFGIYRGMFFIEPGKKAELLFPPLREKDFADEKNPFFEPVSFWFGLKNDEGLNKNVASFDAKFNQLTNQYFNQLYFRQSKAVFDTVAAALTQAFPVSAMPVFEIHKKLKLRSLETEVFRLKAEEVAGVFNTVTTEFWTYPAFSNFFDKTFVSRLSFDAKEPGGEKLKNAVGNANAGILLNHIKNKYKLNGDVVALALLKMLYDGFYSGEFAKSSILQVLRSAELKNHNNSEIRKITASVMEKLTFLQPGSAAPVICLKDIDGNRKCSNETSEKFKYVVFADDEMMVCREHLKYLATVHEKWGKHLEIIVVMRKTDLIEMKMFLDKNHVPGLKLIDEKGEFARQYNVKSFPACFLFDEKHRVVFENAKAPLDGFEQQFGAFLQQELFERQRNQGR